MGWTEFLSAWAGWFSVKYWYRAARAKSKFIDLQVPVPRTTCHIMHVDGTRARAATMRDSYHGIMYHDMILWSYYDHVWIMYDHIWIMYESCMIIDDRSVFRRDMHGHQLHVCSPHERFLNMLKCWELTRPYRKPINLITSPSSLDA